MLTNTDSSLDGLITVNESPEASQDAYKALIADIAENIVKGEQAIYEKQLWELPLDIDLIDHLGEIPEYEAALVLIEQNIIPTDNFYFQSVVVRLAFNAIQDNTEFAWICENSRFTQQQVQAMIDLAANTVLWNENFALAETYKGSDLMYYYDKVPNLLGIRYNGEKCACGCTCNKGSEVTNG
jgi:hypothetical protein